VFFVPSTGLAQIIRKSTIAFYSQDSILITADQYYSKMDDPYIVLLHQENSSRGVFDSIAERFVKMNFNCLAVDLRNGNRYKFIKNETAIRARDNNKLTNIQEAEKDVNAAIDFIFGLNRQPVVLLGSSASATLAMKVATENTKVRAVIALSPGDFYQSVWTVDTLLHVLKDKPVFIAGNTHETDYYLNYESSLKNKNNHSLLKPSKPIDLRGTELLMSNNPLENEYWFSLLVFIKFLKETEQL